MSQVVLFTVVSTIDALHQALNTHPALQPTDCRRSPSVTIVLAEEDKIDPSGLSRRGAEKDRTK